MATEGTRSKRQATTTKRFGTGRRDGHDASEFYARFPDPVVSDDDTVIVAPPSKVNRVELGDARTLDLPDNSAALIVTSPPYFAGKDYETDGRGPQDFDAYLDLLADTFSEAHRVLEPGGRIAVNVAGIGRRPYRPLDADVWNLLRDIGFLPRGTIIWVKAKGANGSAAWGTWRSPVAPTGRDVHEFVLVAGKGRFNRALHPDERAARGLPHAATLEGDEFMASTLSVWHIPPASAKRTGHPAPFPVDLPQRIIRLHTFADDLVVDPFMGSGTTALAAAASGRRFYGVDSDPDYVELANARLRDAGVPPPPDIVDLR